MENKQTAVEWLFNQLSEKTQANNEKEYWKAKQMEKEQIEKAFQHSMVAIIVGKILSPEQYYNETYGKQDKQTN
jgi:hypothetical protein